MKIQVGLIFAVAMIVSVSGARAQSAEPTYKGDPAAYKVIFEDANFRVIESIHKPGVKDKTHGHPVPSILVNLTDCKAKLYAADGTTRELDGKAGSVSGVPVIASHTAENTGAADCHQIFVEKK